MFTLFSGLIVVDVANALLVLTVGEDEAAPAAAAALSPAEEAAAAEKLPAAEAAV